jgi:hypothetical protein
MSDTDVHATVVDADIAPAQELKYRRVFEVIACANERALEGTLNKLEEDRVQIGDIFHKPTGGYAVVAIRFVPLDAAEETSEPESTPHGATNAEEESDIESNPPETI